MTQAIAVPQIPIPRDEIAAFCRKRRITALALFGSVLRDDFTPESDVDMLARFGPDAERSFGAFMRAQDELGSILGRKVDLVEWEAVEESRNYYRRKAVLDSAQVIYDAAWSCGPPSRPQLPPARRTRRKGLTMPCIY